MAVKQQREYVVYGLFCVCRDCRLSSPGEIRYVGATGRVLETRVRNHLRSATKDTDPGYRTAKSRWVRKHGSENIRSVLLDNGIKTAENAALSESFWIEKLETYSGFRGLNLSTGGEGIFLRRPRTPEQVGAVSQANRGRKFSIETRKLMSELAKKRLGNSTGGANGVVDEYEVRQIKVRIWNGSSPADIAEEYGVTRSQIQHISNNRSWTHVPWPIGPRRKPKRKVQRRHSAETRAKMSESHKKRALDG